MVTFPKGTVGAIIMFVEQLTLVTYENRCQGTTLSVRACSISYCNPAVGRRLHIKRPHQALQSEALSKTCHLTIPCACPSTSGQEAVAQHHRSALCSCSMLLKLFRPSAGGICPAGLQNDDTLRRPLSPRAPGNPHRHNAVYKKSGKSE